MEQLCLAALIFTTMTFFGLALMDRMKLFNKTQTKYKKPSKKNIKKNAAHIKGFRERKMLEYIKGV